MSRILARFALLLSTASLVGCASLPQSGPLAFEEPPTTVRVENRNSTRLVVYAVLDGSQQRLGSVPGGSTADLVVPARFLARGDAHLVAVPNGAGGNSISQPLMRSHSRQLHWLVSPGSEGVLTSLIPGAKRG